MAVPDADPDAQALTAAFEQAMGAAPKPLEPPPPPENDPDAPHGRGEDGQPLAPYGLTRDGRPKLTAAGRHRKRDPDNQPRTAPAAGGEIAKTGTVLEARDYTEAIGETGEVIWLGITAAAHIPLEKIPVLGPRLGNAEIRLHAQAALFDEHRPALAGALNLAAQHNARARAIAEKMATGDVSWQVGCVVMTLPFFMQSAALWQGDDRLDVQALADANKASWDEWLDRIRSAAQAGIPAGPAAA